MSPQADILIVTVTPVESRAVLQAFPQATGRKPELLSIRDRTYFNLGSLNGARIFHTQCEMGTSGPDASLLAIQKGIDALTPLAVIMVGIAFGINPEKQTIGDILVSQQLRPYDLQRHGTIQDGQPKISLRSDKPHASPWLLNHLKSTHLLWQAPPKVRFGVVLTGEKLVDNLNLRQHLLDLEPDAIGGEMEGTGLYTACQDKKVDWILVKGICDWADGHKAEDKDNRQHTAAQNATQFVIAALQLAPLDWQSQRLPSLPTNPAPASPPAVTPDPAVLQPALDMAQRSLAFLEQQAAGYTSLTIPTHLQLALEDKRQEVAELEARLQEK